jgi:hypothetical protein
MDVVEILWGPSELIHHLDAVPAAEPDLKSAAAYVIDDRQLFCREERMLNRRLDDHRPETDPVRYPRDGSEHREDPAPAEWREVVLGLEMEVVTQLVSENRLAQAVLVLAVMIVNDEK